MTRTPPPVATSNQTSIGILYGVLCFLLWGFMPLYWRQLAQVAAPELLAHRIVWSLGLVVILLIHGRRFREFGASLRKPRLLVALVASATLIGANWGLYIWAVNSGHVLQSSLGYYINPLINVLLGSFFLGERLLRMQKLAVMIAAGGVFVMASGAGQFPWIALALAGSFATYGLIRKLVSVDSLLGLALESMMLFPMALAYLIWLWSQDELAFGRYGLNTDLLISMAGPLTALPLLWFAHAARRLRLSTVGLLQYIAPTCQFLLAVFAFGEAFTERHALAFGLIWIALAIYAISGRRRRDVAAVSETVSVKAG